MKALFLFISISFIPAVFSQFGNYELVTEQLTYWAYKKKVRVISYTVDETSYSSFPEIREHRYYFDTNGNCTEYRQIWTIRHLDAYRDTSLLEPIGQPQRDNYGVWRQEYKLDTLTIERQYLYDDRGETVFDMYRSKNWKPFYEKCILKSIKYGAEKQPYEMAEFSSRKYAEWIPLFDTLSYLTITYEATNTKIYGWVRAYDQNQDKHNTNADIKKRELVILTELIAIDTVTISDFFQNAEHSFYANFLKSIFGHDVGYFTQPDPTFSL
jgi:hypothetical protein